MLARLKRQLVDVATAPYRDTGVFNYRWARGKLSGDPVFPALLEHSAFPDNARVLDLGCGRGLLAAWFLAAEQLAGLSQWPEAVPPPSGLRFRGVEMMAREAECGNRALQGLHGDRVQLFCGDMREAVMDDIDAIAILDVLHYIPWVAQDGLLDRIRAALPPGGIFVTRIGNADGGLRFRASQFVDACISFVQGHRLERMWCRPVHEWVRALESRGFAVKALPMSSGTPFANVLLICRVQERPGVKSS
jgi:SAM-dependent methyltransferase